MANSQESPGYLVQTRLAGTGAEFNMLDKRDGDGDMVMVMDLI